MNALRASRVVAWIVRPSADLLAFALIVCTVAGWDAAFRAQFFDECYALALVFQMFSASTGFRERAVRGHFDFLLTRASRSGVAAGHLLASIAPGLLVWTVVIGIDAVGVRRIPTGICPAAVIALLSVSLIAWAAGLALPRYGAAVLWLAVVVIVAGSGYASRIRTNSLPGEPLVQWTTRTVGFVGAPMLLVADPVTPSPFTLAAVGACAVGAALLGAAYFSRLDAALQELA